MLDSLEISLCQMQAHLFELSVEKGYDSEAFVKAFMSSTVAEDLDRAFHHAQWAGEEYLISRFSEENPKAIRKGFLYDAETLYWSGYLYRYWHFYTGETSKAIYKQAPITVLKQVYLPYHALSIEMAIDRLKETYVDKKAKKNRKAITSDT